MFIWHLQTVRLHFQPSEVHLVTLLPPGIVQEPFQSLKPDIFSFPLLRRGRPASPLGDASHLYFHDSKALITINRAYLPLRLQRSKPTPSFSCKEKMIPSEDGVEKTWEPLRKVLDKFTHVLLTNVYPQAFLGNLTFKHPKVQNMHAFCSLPPKYIHIFTPKH